MTTYDFHFGIANSVCDELRQITGRLQADLTEGEQEAEISLKDWSDEAKDAYASYKSEWDRIASQMPATLDRAQQALVEITNGYFQIEKAGVNAWSG
jgi:ElaB/YqjD/DUF883 family membrane-anchored ribosome-binding protein